MQDDLNFATTMTNIIVTTTSYSSLLNVIRCYTANVKKIILKKLNRNTSLPVSTSNFNDNK